VVSWIPEDLVAVADASVNVDPVASSALERRGV